MGTSVFVYAPKVLFDFFVDALYFLPWWYTKGLRSVAQTTWQTWKGWERELALRNWARHFFKPVTARVDQGIRVRDLTIRMWGIAWRSLVLAAWSFVAVVTIIVYVSVVPFAAWQVVYQIITIG